MAAPGQTAPGLRLQTATLDVIPTLMRRDRILQGPTGPITATYFSGANGVLTNPAEPALPLDAEGVGLTDYVLRGVGFMGGDLVQNTVRVVENLVVLKMEDGEALGFQVGVAFGIVLFSCGGVVRFSIAFNDEE